MPFIERLRAVVAILLLVGAALFVVGVAVERAAIANESSSAAHPSSPESPHHVEGSGAEGSGSEATGAESGRPATAAPEAHSDETLLGANIESWPLAIGAAIVSMGIAFAAWRWRQRAILPAVAMFAVAFAVLDIREVTHQSSEGRTGIVVLAGLIALVHLAVAALAAFLATRTTPPITA